MYVDMQESSLSSYQIGVEQEADSHTHSTWFLSCESISRWRGGSEIEEDITIMQHGTNEAS